MAKGPIELIGEGIKQGDWAKISRAYQRMTGKKVRPLVAEESRDKVDPELQKQIQKIIKVIWGEQAGNLINLADKLSGHLSTLNGNKDADEEEEPAQPRRKPKKLPLKSQDDLVYVPDDSLGGDHQAIGDDSPIPAAVQAAIDQVKAELDALPTLPKGPESVEDRAKEARERLQRGESPDFTIVHQGMPEQDVDPEKGRRCKTEPFKPGLKNEFIDDGSLARREIKFDKKVTKGVKPTPRRPKVKPIKVTCFKCEKPYLVEPSLAPRTIKASGETDVTNYVCDNCTERPGRE